MTITGTSNVGSWVGGFAHHWGSIQSRGRGPLAEHSESPLQDIYPRHPPSLLWETERKLKWHFFRYSVNTVKHWKKITLICLFGINNHLIERRCHVSMVATYFWITTMGSLSNNDCDQNKNGEKAISSYKQNFVVHFSVAVASLQLETS